jgi:hypothetical protein
MMGLLATAAVCAAPVCFDASTSNPTPKGHEAVALADAHRREPRCDRDGEQCSFSVSASQAGEIRVSVERAFVDASGTTCLWPVDLTHVYRYTREGVFFKQDAAP